MAMRLLGWCNTGHHDDGVERQYSRPCPGFIKDTGVICSCPCHFQTGGTK